MASFKYPPFSNWHCATTRPGDAAQIQRFFRVHLGKYHIISNRKKFKQNKLIFLCLFQFSPKSKTYTILFEKPKLTLSLEGKFLT